MIATKTKLAIVLKTKPVIAPKTKPAIALNTKSNAFINLIIIVFKLLANISEKWLDYIQMMQNFFQSNSN